MHRWFVLEPISHQRAALFVCLSVCTLTGENLITDCPRRRSYQRTFGQGFNSPRVHQKKEQSTARMLCFFFWWTYKANHKSNGGELNAALRNCPVDSFSGDRSILKGIHNIYTSCLSKYKSNLPSGPPEKDSGLDTILSLFQLNPPASE